VGHEAGRLKRDSNALIRPQLQSCRSLFTQLTAPSHPVGPITIPALGPGFHSGRDEARDQARTESPDTSTGATAFLCDMLLRTFRDPGVVQSQVQSHPV
jgi:hypothetical protein